MRRYVRAFGVLFLVAVPLSARGPFNDKPASPQSLPGDTLPPFGMLDESGHLLGPPPLPPGVHLPRAHGPAETRAPSLSMADALRVAQAAVNFCMAEGYRTGAAVVDSQGEARAMVNADGADGSHVFVAMRKAEVAVVFGRPSAAARDAIAKDPALLKRVTPAMFVEGGGVPIMRGGRLIGAVAVSGAAGMPIGHQDEVCAAAGLRVLGRR